jgi:hypothetical protein
VALKGCTEPRVFTPPLRELTPDTTMGYDIAGFAETVLGVELLPWQRWLVIHAFEIEGEFGGTWRFRFRTVLVLVARQNGKTLLSKVIAAFFLWVLGVALVIGTSTNLEAAEEVWESVVELAEDVPDLKSEVQRVYRSAGNKTLSLVGNRKYRVTTSNRKGARGKSGDLILLDELREHQTWDAWDAVSNTTVARPNALIWCMSNAGDGSSVVLRYLRAQAHKALGDPDGWAASYGDVETDDTLAIFEWSAEPDASTTDRHAWAQANPSLGYGFMTERALLSQSSKPRNSFLTENLCQWVTLTVKPPFPNGSWEAGIDKGSRIAPDSPLVYGLDVSADRQHASMAVCGLRSDGRYHVELIAYRGGLKWVLDGVQRLAENSPHHAVRIAAQAKGAPVSSLLDLIEAVDGVEVVPCQGRDVAGWCGRFWDAVNASNPDEDARSDSLPVAHIAQPALDLAANVAVTRPMGDGAWAWDRGKSTEDISPLVAVTMAYGAATDAKQPEAPSAYEDHDLMFV